VNRGLIQKSVVVNIKDKPWCTLDPEDGNKIYAELKNNKIRKRKTNRSLSRKIRNKELLKIFRIVLR
jgi:hypothetical protein